MTPLTRKLQDRVNRAAANGQEYVHVKLVLLERALLEIERLERQLERADDRIQEKSRLRK